MGEEFTFQKSQMVKGAGDWSSPISDVLNLRVPTEMLVQMVVVPHEQ